MTFMLNEILYNISQYGYLAIFLLVFLQEVGVPSPIPNELLLIFCGYLSFTGILNLPLVLLLVLAADLLSSGILYVVFYFFGQFIFRNKPRWLPISEQKIDRLTQKLNVSGQSSIFIGRLTPFIKGYVTVLCGLLRISPKKYLITALVTSIIWTLFYVGGGFLIGPYWNLISKTDISFDKTLMIIIGTIILIFIGLQLHKTIFQQQNKTT
jgi:membrane protein DedA with SNARE-associated domain